MLVNNNALHLPLSDQSVHCCITSPPYWGLRDYGLDDAGIGLEPTPEEYVANMVQVFREVWRVLRDDGTAWVNLGDSYTSGGRASRDPGQSTLHPAQQKGMAQASTPLGLKPKDLMGMPWRLAFALQADGWYLRSDIIWAKPNPMPESVTDRPTKSHEYVFLLSKRARYFYDADAVREGISKSSIERWNGMPTRKNPNTQGIDVDSVNGERCMGVNPAGRNRRTVWTIPTAPFSGAHFATFPPKLIEPMVRAGTSELGVCPECGAPWQRVTEKTAMVIERSSRTHSLGQTRSSGKMIKPATSKTVGFHPTCSHSYDPIPATVLDPFVGSGTTVQVARSLGRAAIGLDLSFEYLKLAKQRLGLDKIEEWGQGIQDDQEYDNLPLFNTSSESHS